MLRVTHRIILLLAFVLVAAVARGQLDVCITFADIRNGQMPSGWMVAHGPNYSHTYNDAYVTNVAHNSPKSLGISGNPDFYLSMPYMSADFSQGAYMQYWAVEGGNIEVGTMTDPTDYTTFHRLTASTSGLGGLWKRYVVDLSSAPQGDHYITFHKLSSVYYTQIDDVRVISDGCLMWDFRTANYDLEQNNGVFAAIYQGCESVLPPVQFTWNVVGSPAVHVTVADPDGNSLLNGIYNGVDTVSVPLSENVTYTVSVYADCGTSGDCSTSTETETYTVSLIHPECDSSSCVDTRKLFSTKATPFYGLYDNPYQNVGLDDFYGTSNRHIVCTDTTLYDLVVGPQLRMIPPGDDHSVRLGNQQVGRRAEAMLYSFNVDTSDFDMLILKYAAVMQDPQHNPYEQPRFRIEMLDAEGNLIHPAACNSYDFVANSNMGWNITTYINALVLWKDWTIVGIDLSAYHGQTVRLRLTTYDCDEGGHFGYAYYNIHCAKKTLSFSGCSNGQINHVEAPEGFNYSWRRDDSYAVISTSRIAYLPVDGHTYYCDLSFIGDPTCVVTLSAVSRRVGPEADFDYTVSRDDCRFRVDFHDLSHLDDDTATTCDSVYWDFGPFGTSTLRNPVVFFPDSGTYTVSLVAALPGGSCLDTITRQLRLEYAYDTVDTSVCVNRPLRFMDSLFSVAGSYVLRIDCDSLRLLNLAMRDTALIDTVAVVCDHLDYRGSTFASDTVAEFVYTNTSDCDSTYRLHLTVNPEYNLSDTIVVCPGRPFLYRGVDYGGPTAFDTMLATVHGCDSLVHVSITERDTIVDIGASYSFDGMHWTDTLPVKGCAPATLHLRDTTPEIASRHWVLAADSTYTYEGTLVHRFEKPFYDAKATLMLTDIHDCHDTLEWPIFIFPSPKADFAWHPEHPSDVHPEAQMLNNSTPDDCRWQWLIQSGDGDHPVDTLTEYSPYYRWRGTLPRGDFDATLIASHRYWHDTISHYCSDTARHTITIVTAWLEFPNLVTPNGDSINDFWGVVNLVELGQYPQNELWIYNSWGVLVYHAKDIYRSDQFWYPDATNSPDGTYYFRFMGKSAYGIVRRNGLIEVVRD